MIARIEALNYRCFQHVAQELRPFNVLVGPNGSGKSTFLDVLGLLRDSLTNGIEEAILMSPDPGRPGGRARRVEELFFQGQGNCFELAVELEPPQRLRKKGRFHRHRRVRYVVAFGREAEGSELVVLAEKLCPAAGRPSDARAPGRSSPSSRRRAAAPRTLFNQAPRPGQSPVPAAILLKTRSSPTTYVRTETQRRAYRFKIDKRRSMLANLPEDHDKFPVALWTREVLQRGVQGIMPNVTAMYRPCSPAVPRTFLPDGSNLPRVVADLRKKDPGRFKEWVRHVRTILPDVEGLRVLRRVDDKHSYLMLKHTDGHGVPSWLLSDGTLRMLLLTLLPYLAVQDSVYLIEEPENGMHPSAIESVLDSLTSVYDGQVLLATHSPLIVSRTELSDLLCFRRTESGAAEVIRGDQHPHLADWKGEVDLATLYAAGVLS